MLAVQSATLRARHHLGLAADQEDEPGAGERQEDHQGEERPVAQMSRSAYSRNRYQVTRAATPISMAKA